MAQLMRELDWSARRWAARGMAFAAAHGRVADAGVALPDVRRLGPGARLHLQRRLRRILGGRHPQALGMRFHDIWADIWTTSSR
jgi:hypothetical protein